VLSGESRNRESRIARPDPIEELEENGTWELRLSILLAQYTLEDFPGRIAGKLFDEDD
jgi:hypothetical protein